MGSFYEILSDVWAGWAGWDGWVGWANFVYIFKLFCIAFSLDL